MDVIRDIINSTLSTENQNTNKSNSTSNLPSDPKSLCLSSVCLFIMALVPIYIGSKRSVIALVKQKKSGEKVETLSNNDAAMFPVYASIALFGLFVFFKVFSKEYINMLLSFYFFFLGFMALAHLINPIVKPLIPSCFTNSVYKLSFTEEPVDTIQAEEENKNENSNKDSNKITEHFNFTYERKEFIGLGIGLAICLCYLKSKHWILNNLMGFAFSVNAIELLQLNKVMTGCILLGGLFIYDIFWVFGTNVMVTVAKSFEAPIKLVFPRDLFLSGFNSTNYAMLGLGDIVVPGIFIALLLRFDKTLKNGKNIYFYSGFIAYILGLVTTMIIMHVFKHAQPALLYLVPSCLGVPIVLSILRGEFTRIFQYEDNPKKED